MVTILVPVLGMVWVAAAFGIAGSIDAFGLWQSEPVHILECGSVLADPTSAIGLQTSLKAAVVVDDGWQGLGIDGSEARSIVVEAAGLLRGTGVSITSVSVGRWNPPPEAKSPDDVLTAAKEYLPLGDADIIIVLTSRSETRGDGAADVGGRYAVVQHHRGEREKDVAVLAHELGHLLGAYHGCDSPTGGGVMAATGFSNADLLCPCTRRVIEQNVSMLHSDPTQSP